MARLGMRVDSKVEDAYQLLLPAGVLTLPEPVRELPLGLSHIHMVPRSCCGSAWLGSSSVRLTVMRVVPCV